MTEEEKMLAGQFYNSLDPALVQKREAAQALCLSYNAAGDPAQRAALLSKLLGSGASDVTLQGPIHFTYGFSSHFGVRCYANFNLTVLDHGGVTVGNGVMFGPNCTLITAIHPLHREDRKLRKGADGSLYDVECTAPIRIGDDCWLAANVTVCPGVSIGEGSVIGAGSVVTQDVPAGVFAAGVPCRVIRSITEADRLSADAGMI